MFLGIVPTECLRQIIKVMDVDKWTDVHVCCSGTFRMDRALASVNPKLRVHSNDVSLFSCAIGGLATDKPVEFTFRDELAFVEKLYGDADPIHRLAAVMVGFEMARFARRNNEFNIRHFDYYQKRFEHYVDKAVEKVKANLDGMRIESFYGGDWVDHAKAGIEMGSYIVGFPPFAKGGYEAQFKFIDDNVSWNSPKYEIYDPKDLRGITQELEDLGGKYCMLTDQEWDDKEPVLKYTAGLRLPHYCYAETDKSSLVSKAVSAKPFRYLMIDVAKLSENSQVQIVEADSATMNFVKDVYLSKSIKHCSGSQNFLILIDGMLVGSVIYDEGPITRMAYGPRTINLLSDLSVSRNGKLSKLVAMIATSHSLVRAMELKLVKRYDRIVTTAFSKHPSSMKYRGVFKKMSRRENDAGDGFVIQYGADVNDSTPQELYQKWWGKHGNQN